ncbi:alpha/beta hydrolase [Streptomyces zingiberis]|uniref:Alpha/beta hydrolase n=1 Tax=Streptomyces zingiberis TaxID=2053010 RepID=A0ABX1BTE4_9ACTN|nr:alpha/beta hydrolase [Streptomyces zingiberis]NJP99046.1 alpha/beta hydrolase [Streptomyces zingiberis]
MHVRSRPFHTAGVALLAAALVLAGCSSGAADPSADRPAGPRPTGAPDVLEPLATTVPSALRPYYAQKLRWRGCDTAGFECATLKAPLDYARPGDGRDVRLAVSRRKATGPGDPLGSLLVNPGGPGGSAIGYLQNYAAAGYPAPVRERYDMVAVDPRGVAASEPVTCLSDAEMDAYTQVDVTPDSEGETEALVAAYRRFGQGCERRSGEVLGHVSTVESARDMDLLRAALGDEKLTYVGASYGTFLGATYAGLFPSRVGRLVFDGAMDPSLSSRQLNRDQTAGFSTAFTAFAEDCVRGEDCPLGNESVADARRRMSAFFRRLDRRPVPAGNGRELGESLATTGVIAAMYDEGAWPRLRGALKAAMDGRGHDLIALADLYHERDPNGSYQNLMYANPAVNCLDLPASFRSPAEVRKQLASFREASPVFGEGLAWSALNCGYWPVKATGKPHRIEARGAAPILVVGTTRDPATPYVWSRALAAQLDSGTLLTYDGDGHTAYGRGSACVDRAINTYLLKGEAPANGTRCT